MTQSFFVRYPNSMILFEPGKMTSTTEAGNKALLKVRVKPLHESFDKVFGKIFVLNNSY